LCLDLPFGLVRLKKKYFNWPNGLGKGPHGLGISRAGHVERYQLQSYRFKPFFVTL
jgi:hypothetical protein